MGTFTWLGGDIGNGNNWSSGGSTGTEPGPNDVAVLSIGGLGRWRGECRPGRIHGRFRLFRRQSAGRRRNPVSGGSIVQKDGINAIVSSGHSLVLIGASYTLSGGTLSGPQAAEFLSGHLQAIQRHEYSRRY